ncbi:hypothetical protein RJ639_016056 [Escallonia herrerae]|uniref:Ubiquitin-like domain-containing protein n=1 Tax=Escallonia herrerae TaxID=1293975 RepID=A0AA88VBF7_9ASTE|nr:hypothetical protein RJ639_016056 [Escallonia herrerae]
MMKMKPTSTGMSLPAKGNAAGRGSCQDATAWEMRPGGMLVQKRNSDSNQSTTPVPTIRLRVKYGSTYHEVNINSQASFGELKKMLAGLSGLDSQDQKLIFKDKERDSKCYLDVTGVKDGSKLVLIEDAMSRERRCLESRKSANMDKASKEISEISLEIDQLVKQVASLESEISVGKKVVETVLSNLIELLMTQLIKLDGIVADGDVKLHRRMQDGSLKAAWEMIFVANDLLVKRVQKYIETLDMLKSKNSAVSSTRGGAKVPLQQQQTNSNGQMPKPMSMSTPMQKQQQDQRKQRNSAGQMPRPVVVATKWETFDPGMATKVPFTVSSTPKRATTNGSAKLNWEFFE